MTIQNSIIHPYIMIPVLFEQSTWGGTYIASYKGIQSKYPQLQKIRIGQSYELYEGSTVLTDVFDSDSGTIDFGNHSDPTKSIPIDSTISRITLQQLISKNPEQILGTYAIHKHGNKIGILNKFTQAKCNSYQLHVSEDTGKWKSKPESWYYFEPGVITLGMKKDTNIELYKSRCKEIESYGITVTKEIKNNTITREQGEQKFHAFIQSNHPRNYVNVIHVKEGSLFDLSIGKIHHSWEEDDALYPHGNIVYEIQKNVFDEVSTLRSFDQGKIKSDGSVRPLTIDEYFTYINRDAHANDPSLYKKDPILVSQTDTITIQQIFHTHDYSLFQISLHGVIQSSAIPTEHTYCHVFVKSGTISIKYQGTSWIIRKGHCVFLPAALKDYTIHSENQKEEAILLVTSVPK
jgi:mannose-6-phosphate isomerase class I